MSEATSMAITKARINLGAVIERVMNGERITLEKGGIPVATIISREDLEDLEDALELTRLRELQRNEKPEPLEKFLKRHDL